MTTVKRIRDLTQYAFVLPYASEMFGVFQPLLGWKSKRIANRFEQGFHNDKVFLLDKLKREFAAVVDIRYDADFHPEIQIDPGILQGGKIRRFDSLVLQKIAENLPSFKDLRPSAFKTVITPQTVENIVKKDVVEFYTNAYNRLPEVDKRREIVRGAFEHQVQYESAVAGALLFLQQQNAHDALKEIFYNTKDNLDQAQALIRKLTATDSSEAYLDIEHLDPSDVEDLKSVVLSPISVVHLFRQYFFELDTFLGTPESHVWLSPGSSVELLEVHTRRLIVEKTLESALDIVTSAEKATTEQEEISEAVKEDNQQDIKFGASVKASYASIEATSSFDFNTSQKLAREVTHKLMRQQTEKLSSQIRRNFKSTFKTVTEFTDVSSTKHVLANSTQSLINYELRRKMRQVGVQVQDIGSFVCWQTYVDDPGRDLGIAKLVHIAKPAELGAIPHPEEIPLLQPFQEEKIATIPFISVEDTGADNEGEVYKDGVEVDNNEWFGVLEKIQADFPQEFICSKANYLLTGVEFDPQGKPVSVSRRGDIQNVDSKAKFSLHLDSADFQGQNSIQVKLILHWSPTAEANAAIAQKNAGNLGLMKEQEKAAYEKAFVETVKDRVTLASRITTRRSDELREEERIVVYRRLIQDLLFHGVELPDDRTRHVAAELINAMFDVEKMLYFVAPEWWRPRLHRSRQQLQETPVVDLGPTPPTVDLSGSVLQKGLLSRLSSAEANDNPDVLSASTVGWGGVEEANRDNYYITDESEPAKMGSSLGWLLQLDGDNMRNAFLNAPWVKAVMPIRPGKEQAAINWLKGVEGMNGITDDVIYHTSNPNEVDINGAPLDGQRMIDVLMDLARKIERKYQEGIETGKYPRQDEVADPALVDDENLVTATPIDRVYEHGFFPLEGSFRLNVGKNYEIFDQWIEILPTDQVVPVEVAYDPKTGRQV
ncbi:MAG: peptidoglycan-binding protein [Anaerolineae bacterium]